MKKPLLREGASDGPVYYALSIHMKYGEVLHLDDLTKEQKNLYYDLCRDPKESLLIEQDGDIRHLFGADIAKITSKRYNETYRKYVHPLRAALFSESLIGRGIFALVMKLFVFAAILAVGAALFASFMDGQLFDILADKAVMENTVAEVSRLVGRIFRWTLFILFALHVADLLLHEGETYHVNRDGTDVIYETKMGNLFLSAGFIVVVMVFRMALTVASRF
jgi:hypothetical protein